jgi:actin related protein 2/3 complex, subunit 2
MLKPILFAAPFHSAYNEHASLSTKHKTTFQPGMADQAPEERGELKIIRYRDQEAIYIQAANDRVTVIISTLFTDETDRVFGKVFLQVSSRSGRITSSIPYVAYSLSSYMEGDSDRSRCGSRCVNNAQQEFVDARRRSSAIGTAPQVMYTTRDPPLEVRNAPGIAGVKKTEDVGWITFGAFPHTYQHVQWRWRW